MLVRKNLRMSEELASWFESAAKDLGISQSNLMVMALGSYVEQKQAMDIMSNLDETIQKLQEMKELSNINNEEDPKK